MIRSIQHLLVPGVIARERELAELAAFVSEIPRGFRVAVLQGGAGAGKTTLARAAETLAREREHTLLTCTGSELETELSYAALGDLLSPLVATGLDDLPSPQRRAIEVALSLSDPEGDPPDQRAVAVATLGLLSSSAARRPLLAVIDDVQWIDGSSLRVLAFVARRLGDSAVGLVVTRRGDGAAPLGVGRSVDPERVRLLQVGPLPMDAIGRLVQQRLGAPVARPRLREIHRASDGNPFYALELARALDDRPPGSDAPLAVPASLRDLVAARLDGMGRPARRALLLAAAMARPDVTVLRAADAEAEAGLAEAVHAGLVTVDDGFVRFAHPLLAFAAYEDATAQERRAAHRALAGLVDGEERAGHLARATVEPDEEVARILEAAARDARERAAPEAAAHFAAEAARLTASPTHRLERRLEAGRAHAAAGDRDRARRELDAVIAAAEPGQLRARAMHARAVAAWGAESYLDNARLLTRALAQTDGASGFEATVRADLATALLQAGHLRDAQRHARAAVALTDGHDAGAARAVSVMADFLLGEGMRGARLGQATAAGDSPTALSPEFLHVLLLKWSDRLTDARTGLEELRRRAVAEHDDQSLNFVLVQLGELYCWLGDVAAAHDCQRAAAAIAVHGGLDETLALFLEALVGAYTGDVEQSRVAALAAAEIAWATANHRFHIRCLAVVGLGALSVGDTRAAAPHLRRAERMSREAGYAEPGVLRFEHDAVEALLAVGEREEAERICAGLEGRAGEHARPWVSAAATRSRALLRAAEGDFDAAEGELTVALEGFRALGQPLETGRVLMHLGIVRRRRRQKRGAREALEAAAGTFASFGAAAWAQRAQTEAARIGGRPAAPRGLTETERRVAGLAADGATNREIAETLFMSVKTVERHLSHTYAKLGVHSRRELRGTVHDKARVAPRFQTTEPGLDSGAS